MNNSNTGSNTNSNPTLQENRDSLEDCQANISSKQKNESGKKYHTGDYQAHYRSLQNATTEPFYIRYLLIMIAFCFMGLFLLFPLACIFYEAFANGFKTFYTALSTRETLAALRMTLLATGISVPLNVLFGLAAAWCIGKFEFKGKSLLISLIDIPFAISPVIAGILFVFLLGTHSMLGSWLATHNIRLLYAFPAVVMATIFVTFPFVVRELIPVMQTQGTEEEQAARVLGARGWHIFWRVTLPNVKWALLYGIILCNARAMGEFGAVLVVAGNSIKTNTLPLHINVLYQSYTNGTAPFAVATLLVVMAILTLIIKTFIEIHLRRKEGQD